MPNPTLIDCHKQADSDLIFKRYVESNATRILVNPKNREGYFGKMIQLDQNFAITIVWNEEEQKTVKEIEIFDFREGNYSSDQIDPNSIIFDLKNMGGDDEDT